MQQLDKPTSPDNKNQKAGISHTKQVDVKFMKHCVVKGQVRARVWYSLDNRADGRKVVTIYSKDYGHELGAIFSGDEYENRTDTMTDYFDKGTARLFEGHPLYAAARARAEALEVERKDKAARNKDKE